MQKDGHQVNPEHEHGHRSWESIRNVYLLGHSCGAHILSHILFSLPTLPTLPSTPAPTPTSNAATAIPTLRFNLLHHLLPKTRSAAFLDGIYDLPSLLLEYPSYGFFVEAAFGADVTQWVDAGVLSTTTTATTTQEGAKRTRIPENDVLDVLKRTMIVVAHATEDELLTPRQGELWVDYLKEVGLGERTVWDDKTLVGTHDGCLHHVGLGELLYKMMRDV